MFTKVLETTREQQFRVEMAPINARDQHDLFQRCSSKAIERRSLNQKAATGFSNQVLSLNKPSKSALARLSAAMTEEALFHEGGLTQGNGSN
jgi:hypothetical protein